MQKANESINKLGLVPVSENMEYFKLVSNTPEEKYIQEYNIFLLITGWNTKKGSFAISSARLLTRTMRNKSYIGVIRNHALDGIKIM